MVNVDKKKEVGVLGAGRQAAETAGYLAEAGFEVVFFFVESDYLPSTDDIREIAPVLSEKDNLRAYEAVDVISAVGSPRLRKKLVELWPFDNYMSFVHSTAWVSRSAKIGKDVLVPPMCTVNCNVVISDHVLINVGATISHDVALRRFTTLSPGVHIGGGSVLAEGVFCGIGSTIIDSVSLGEGAVVAGGATVIADIGSHTQVGGTPAREMKGLNRWY